MLFLIICHSDVHVDIKFHLSNKNSVLYELTISKILYYMWYIVKKHIILDRRIPKPVEL